MIPDMGRFGQIWYNRCNSFLNDDVHASFLVLHVYLFYKETYSQIKHLNINKSTSSDDCSRVSMHPLRLKERSQVPVHLL